MDKLIKNVILFVRTDAFEESIMGNLIDSETSKLLEYFFAPTETARRHPVTQQYIPVLHAHVRYVLSTY